MSVYLSIIGRSDALAWVLTAERLAFPRLRTGIALQLKQDDELLLYATRGCFNNPTRDRGRVIGLANVVSRPQTLDKPPVFDGRTFEIGCRIRVLSLTRFGDGVDVASLVSRLEVFPDAPTWSAWMRRALLRLPDHDAQLLKDLLSKVATTPAAAVGDYVRRARPASAIYGTIGA